MDVPTSESMSNSDTKGTKNIPNPEPALEAALNEEEIPKIPIHRKILGFLASSTFRNTFKRTLVYWLAFLLIFIDDIRNYLMQNPKTFFNIILPTVVLDCATSVGALTQSAVLFVIGVLLGSTLFTLEAGAVGNNEAGMVVILFLVVYLASITRSISMKYFGFSLLVCVGVFQGISTRILTGTFQRKFLSDSMVAYFIGVAAVWAVNIIVFPTTAEYSLVSRICISLTHLSSFHKLILKHYLLSLNENELVQIKALSAKIHSDSSALVSVIDELDSEITYSKFSKKEYKNQVKCINLMQQHLLSLYNNMPIDTKRSKERFDKDLLYLLEESIMELGDVCRKSKIFIKTVLDPEYHKNKNLVEVIPSKEIELEKGIIKDYEEDDIKEISDRFEKICQVTVKKSLKEYEDKQYNIMLDLLHLDDLDDIIGDLKDDVVDDDGDDNNNSNKKNITLIEGNDNSIVINEKNKLIPRKDAALKDSTWEDIFFIYFFMFGIREYVKELFKLGEIVSVNNKGKKRFRFDYKWMIPNLFRRKNKKPTKNRSKIDNDDEDDDDDTKITSIRTKLAKASFKFKDSINIFAIKSAIALIIVVLPLLIGGNAKNFSMGWNINSAAILVLILMSPVIGQTYLSFLFMIVGSVIGTMWAYISLITWHTNPYGLSFFIILYGLPMSYLANKPQFVIVSILSRLSYAMVLLPQYALMKQGKPTNGINPDSPIVSAYKNLVVTAVAILLVFILQILIYPNLARHEIRRKLSNILIELILYYEDFAIIHNRILSNTSLSQKEQIDKLDLIDHDLRKVELKIRRSLIKIQPLLIFSSAEPRLAAPFPVEKYAFILTHLRHILDRLSWARLATVSRKNFSNDVIQNFIIPLHDPRTRLQSVIIVMMYLYANVLVSKRPLPRILPKSVEIRDGFLKEIISLIKTLTIKTGEEKGKVKLINDDGECILKDPGYIRFYAITLAMRGVANHVDAIGDVLKDLFGEMIDYT